MTRIGILGGTFNPVHNGHLQLADGAGAALGLTRIIWVPAGVPALKPLDPGASAEDRFQMVSLAIEGRPDSELSRVELDRSGPSYAVDTVRRLQQDTADSSAEWFFLIGSDAAMHLPQWNRVEELLERIQFAVVTRPRAAAELVLPFADKVQQVSVDTDPISSSEIRRRIRAGEGIDRLVPPRVARYIRENDLYRKQEAAK